MRILLAVALAVAVAAAFLASHYRDAALDAERRYDSMCYRLRIAIRGLQLQLELTRRPQTEEQLLERHGTAARILLSQVGACTGDDHYASIAAGRFAEASTAAAAADVLREMAARIDETSPP